MPGFITNMKNGWQRIGTNDQDQQSQQYILFPVQWLVLIGNFLLIATYIATMLVPWVNANVEISQAWFKVYIPVEIGLLKCFSEICSIRTISDGGQGGKIPGAPPGMDADTSSNQSLPFEIANVMTIILNSASVVAALVAGTLEALRIFERVIVSYVMTLRLTFLSAIILLISSLSYLLITLGFIHGGNYVVGFWLSLGISSLVLLLEVTQAFVNREKAHDIHEADLKNIYPPASFIMTNQNNHRNSINYENQRLPFNVSSGTNQYGSTNNYV